MRMDLYSRAVCCMSRARAQACMQVCNAEAAALNLSCPCAVRSHLPLLHRHVIGAGRNWIVAGPHWIVAGPIWIARKITLCSRIDMRKGGGQCQSHPSSDPEHWYRYPKSVDPCKWAHIQSQPFGHTAHSAPANTVAPWRDTSIYRSLWTQPTGRTAHVQPACARAPRIPGMHKIIPM